MGSREDRVAPAANDSATLWQQLLAASDLSSYASAWLALQCRTLALPARGAVFLPAVAEPGAAPALAPVAAFPLHAENPAWQDIADSVLAQGRGLVSEPELAGGRSLTSLGFPVHLEEGGLAAVVVVEIEAAGGAQVARAMEALRWGVAGLELMFLRQDRTSAHQLLARNKVALEIMAAALAAADFHASALAAVTALASALGCDRASWGVVSGLEVHVEALSHSAQHAPKMGQVRAIVAGMEDALHATATVAELSRDTPGLRALVQESGLSQVLAVPGHLDGAYRAVLLLEREGEPFSAEERQTAEALVAFLLPVLETRRRAAVRGLERWRLGLRDGWRDFLAPASTLRRYVVTGLLAVLVLLAVIPVPWRITNDIVLEGAEKRAVVAPFDGFLASAPVRAGDVVQPGQALAALDDRDLRLEQLKWVGQLAQYQGQFQQALGEHDRARANISLAQSQQADAELSLVATRLSRTQITAPIAGLVLSGDLSQRLGSRVSQGEVLYEIAPLSDYRVVLKVDERYITDIARKQHGRLVLASLPDDAFDFEVTRLTAIAVAEGGINYFRVEGRLLDTDAALRPGMEGVGKVVAGYRPLLWVWMQPVVDWMRLWLWRWLP
ncbi:MAG: putative phytochrome sensor protein [Moraxellaceae bacterium]|nr:putative phytochrome sensor protein [Moraxellaceae bacterium]